MYFDLHQTTEYIQKVARLGKLAEQLGIDLFVIPDFLSLQEADRTLKGTNILLGAQDLFWEDAGAYTGEVSPKALRQAGVSIVEIGHAERRRFFRETDDQVAQKAAAAVRNGLIPLICVGEKTNSKIASAAVGMAIEECRIQVTKALATVPDDAEIIIAYEPVWAIGAAKPANPDHVINVTNGIRRMTESRSGITRILYGGSAGPGTFSNISSAVDGLFLGRFAHDILNLEKVIMEIGKA
jgi:triosephosphate isomerase